MAFMTRELAQEIVNRTMAILDWNINVMNEEGIIIGSGDANRIGDVHEGAILVLRHKKKIEVREEREGMKPGINFPIFFNEQIVGVVGITGDPREVQAFAELIKMSAELVLEQSFLLEQFQWKQRIQNDLVNQLITGTGGAAVVEKAGSLGINLDLPRVALVLEGGTEPDEQNLLRSIEFELDKGDVLGVTPSNEIILFKVVGKGLKIPRRFRPGPVGVGGVTESSRDWRNSYEQGKLALAIGRRMRPGLPVYSYEEYRIEALLLRMIEQDPDIERFSYYLPLLEHAEGVETLDAYLQENGELNRTAERLFIHRNTLRYRLDKIFQWTGKDPRKIRDLMELYVAKLFHESH
ncbi:CdaR family transcriptional regulator [Rossellomorea marisflavi]|uniref:CdaR family transcriptional regulator n=1 Tax=Rossellomorea marisflavi TaxID=189381 RepID=UPI0011E6B288|nr:sugar diacid recognition domain-containing protein [Rossellomorea marisflavi]TYO69667.1 sugar diacid utilization regulator [Rossellomorea marisflavi]